jgi:hypothetical protein
MLHAGLIIIAIPLLVGTHLIIKNFDITKSDSHQKRRDKESEAERWFARLMFGWFGGIISIPLALVLIMR